MATRALLVGINDYPDAPLRGCRNDALDLGHRLVARGAQTTTLLDSDATKANIKDVLEDLVFSSRMGDHIIWGFSGHGTYLFDHSGDESDQRDEALVAYDYLDGGLIVDDEIHEISVKRKRGVRFTTIADACHVGTITRFAPNSKPYGDAKFLSPLTFLEGAERTRVLQTRGLPSIRPRNNTSTILMAACKETQVAYDAEFNGRPNGAFTRALLDALPEHRVTYGAWMASTTALLDKRTYPQDPQFFGKRWQRYLPF